MTYHFEVDSCSRQQWYSFADGFLDHNIYQCWDYARLHSAGPFRKMSHAILFSEDQPVIMAAFRIKQIPLSRTGIAELDWGPLWHRRESHRDERALGIFLDHIAQEYAQKRNLTVRLRPRSTLSLEGDQQLTDLFQRHGFKNNSHARPYHTVLLDMNIPLEEIRAQFHRKWRNHLNRAEKSNLTIQVDHTCESFDRFYTLYWQMWRKKKFPTGVRVKLIRQLQRVLPDSQRFMMTVVQQEGRDIGTAACSLQGDTMIRFLAATSLDFGRDSQPGYFMVWNDIQEAKKKGIRWCDLGGFNDAVPPIAIFKKRTNGRIVVYPGQFEMQATHSASKGYTWLEQCYRKARHMFTGR